MVPPALTYRARLRLEGFVLAASGAAGSIALLALDADATDMPVNTLGQLAFVLALLAWLGPRSVGRAIAAARPADEMSGSIGEPTPPWQLPLVVAVLSGFFLLGDAPDAALRVTGGCVLVGLVQAVLLERQVARAEREQGRVFARAPGSRILRGTPLAWVPATP